MSYSLGWIESKSFRDMLTVYQVNSIALVPQPLNLMRGESSIAKEKGDFQMEDALSKIFALPIIIAATVIRDRLFFDHIDMWNNHQILQGDLTCTPAPSSVTFGNKTMRV